MIELIEIYDITTFIDDRLKRLIKIIKICPNNKILLII